MPGSLVPAFVSCKLALLELHRGVVVVFHPDSAASLEMFAMIDQNLHHRPLDSRSNLFAD